MSMLLIVVKMAFFMILEILIPGMIMLLHGDRDGGHSVEDHVVDAGC